MILKKNVSVVLICQGFRTHILLLRQEACNVDTKVALPWLPEFFFSCLGATDWSIQLLYASRRCFAKDLWHPEKYNASFNKCKLRSLKLKTAYLGPDLPSMFLKLIIFPLLFLQEQSSNFVHTSRLDTLTARKDSSKKTIDPSAMFCTQNRERTGEKFPGCEVTHEVTNVIRLI